MTDISNKPLKEEASKIEQSNTEALKGVAIRQG